MTNNTFSNLPNYVLSAIRNATGIGPNTIFQLTSKTKGVWLSISNFSAGLLQSTSASAFISNLGLGTASNYNVGTTTGTIPTVDTVHSLVVSSNTNIVVNTVIPTSLPDGTIYINPQDTATPVIGPAGPPNVISPGTVSTLTYGSAPTISFSGVSPTQTLNLGIPAGQPGATGPAPTISAGTITSLAYGSSLSVTLTGTSPNYLLNVAIPQGAPGTNGLQLNLTPGTLTSLSYGSTITASITGTFPNQVLNLGVPVGAPGSAGLPCSLSIGTVSSLAYGSNPTAGLSGTSPNYSLSFGIPSGETGPAPVITVGSVTTLTSGSNATVSVSGTSPNYSLSFGIPAGTPGLGADFELSPVWFSDFPGATASSQYAPFYYTNFGTSSALQAPSANIVAPNHPGVLQWRAGTSGTSGTRVGTDQHMILIGGNEIYTTSIYFQSFTTEGYNIGFNDTVGNGDSTNGVYIYMTSSGVFAGKTSQTSTRSTTGTNYTCSLSTWYRFVILLASGASRVTFYIYNDAGTLLWSDYLTTNLPTAAGQQTGASNIAWSTRTDGSTGYFDTDFIKVNFGPLMR